MKENFEEWANRAYAVKPRGTTHPNSQGGWAVSPSCREYSAAWTTAPH